MTVDPESPTLRIHEKARAAFDARGIQLKQQLRRTTGMPSSSGWRPDVHTREVPIADVLDPQRSRTSGDIPQVTNAAFGSGIGLSGPDARAFDRLCSAIRRAIQPQDLVGDQAVVAACEAWLFDRRSHASLTQHCLEDLTPRIRPYVVSVPIEGLYIQTPLQVGRVTFAELSASTIRRWFSGPAYDALPGPHRAHVDAFQDRFAEAHRGRAVGAIGITAEPTLARELSLAQVEAALGVLRFFSPAALDADFRSICVPSGRERKHRFEAVVEHAGTMECIESGLLDGETAAPWFLTTDELRRIRDDGFEQASQLLCKEAPSELEKAVLLAMLLYSDSTLEHRAHIRLMLTFSAIESIYLANDSERPSQSLVNRLPVAVEKDPKQRAAIRSMLASVYDLRSKFIHHGRTFVAGDVPPDFFPFAWAGIQTALLNTDKVTWIADFTKALDGLMHSEEGST